MGFNKAKLSCPVFLKRLEWSWNSLGAQSFVRLRERADVVGQGQLPQIPSARHHRTLLVVTLARWKRPSWASSLELGASLSCGQGG